jgi:hypothetical protein
MVINDSVKKVDARILGGVDSAEEGAGYSELEIHKFKTKKASRSWLFSGLIKSRLLTATGSAQTGYTKAQKGQCAGLRNWEYSQY